MEIVESEKIKGHEAILLSKLAEYGKDPNHNPSMRLELRDKITIKDHYDRRQIDAVGKRGDFTYIIEAKPKLNFEAIGQVFVYEYLYRKIHPNEKIKKGIVCESGTEDLFSFCTEKDITVFVVTVNGIYEQKPNTI